MFITALFDKSFFQSLSLDEAVMFDNFFVANVCPMYYIETLSDLKKENTKRTPEEEVRILAEKIPELHGAPNMYHRDLCVANLLGHHVSFKRSVIMSHGNVVNAADKIGVHLPPSPEFDAFSRWRNREFLTIEKDIAAEWRQDLQNLDLCEVTQQFRGSVTQELCKSLDEAKNLAVSLTADNSDRFLQIQFYMEYLDIPTEYHTDIVKSLKILDFPELSTYAPYAAHVLAIEWFFRISLASGLISTERPSNWVDITYLFYLPFCRLFVSSDKLHKRCAPSFLSNDQDFIWGPELKRDLRKLVEHYKAFPNSIKDEGLLRFASNPPKEGDFLVSSLWDRHTPRWRTSSNLAQIGDPAAAQRLGEQIRERTKGPIIDGSVLEGRSPDFVTGNREIREFRGSFRQIPKEFADEATYESE